MYDVIEILVFSTPFDKLLSFEDKITKLKLLFSDYILVTGGSLLEHKETAAHVNFVRLEAGYGEVPCVMNLSIRDEVSGNSEREYLVSPKIRFTISLQAGFFDVSTVEGLLNDTIRFFSGLFEGVYFVDVDKKYSLEAMNEGKKYSESDLEDYTFSKGFSEANKVMFDALLYLRFQLKKNILQLEQSQKEVEVLQKSDTEMYQAHGQLDSASKRSIITGESLKKHLQEMDARIISVRSLLIG